MRASAAAADTSFRPARLKRSAKDPVPYSEEALRQDLFRVRNAWADCQAELISGGRLPPDRHREDGHAGPAASCQEATPVKDKRSHLPDYEPDELAGCSIPAHFLATDVAVLAESHRALLDADTRSGRKLDRRTAPMQR